MKAILLISLIIYSITIYSLLKMAKESDEDINKIYFDRKDNKDDRI